MKHLTDFYPINETLVLSDYKLYAKLVTKSYNELPLMDKSVVPHWDALIKSCYVWWKRLISKVDIVFVTENQKDTGNIKILGKEYEIIFWEGGQPYETAQEMKDGYFKTGTLYISIDYSKHPVWSVEENIVFRSVHDYIVHIRGGNEFGMRGEYKAYNLHMKLAPDAALPALFTEIVGQVSVALVENIFPIQKIGILQGFNFKQLGEVDGYSVINKKLIEDV
jgi:hypothetical protein